jgi:hypothetical protein
MQIYYVRTLDEVLERALTPAPSGLPLGALTPQPPVPAAPAVH